MYFRMKQETTDTILELTCERMSYGKDAIAHSAEGKAIFVAGAVTGDTVRARLTETHPNYNRAEAIELMEPSTHRVELDDEHRQLSVGLPWAALAYDQQLLEKRRLVVDALVRTAHYSQENAERLVGPCLNTGKEWGYRNKLELAISHDGGHTKLGMRDETGSFVGLNAAPLLPKRFQKLPRAAEGALSFLSQRAGIDLLRVGIRASEKTGDIEIALWDKPSSFPRKEVARILSDATEANSIVRVLTKDIQKARKITRVEVLCGKGFWQEELLGRTYAVSAPSFFQINSRGAELLIEQVLKAANPQPLETALDLFCGCGTFTLPLAEHTAEVYAVEAYGSAVRDLRRNIESFGQDNIDAIGGDALLEFPDVDADIIVVDPPRAGLGRKLVEHLSAQKARSIIYVSCDPQTLARDLANFEKLGTYQPTLITPVDLFSQSYHVECVTTLKHT